MRYRSKPKEIEAVRVKGQGALVEDPHWYKDAINARKIQFGQSSFKVETATGWAHANYLDWVIKGEFDLYPCAHDVFVASYDRIEA